MQPEQQELKRIIGSFRPVFYAVGAFSLAINVLMLVPAIYMLQIYDRVLSSRNETTLFMLTVIMAGLLLLEAILELVRSNALIRAGVALDSKLGTRLFDASFERYLRSRSGNPTQAFGDLANVRQFLTGKGLFAFFDAPWAPIYIAVIFLLSPWLGLFAGAAAVIQLGLAYWNERLTAPLLDEAGRAALAAGQYAANNLRNAEAVEAMGMLPNLRGRWSARQNRFLALQAVASERAALVGGATRFVRLVMQSGILGIGALLVIDNQLTPGGMIAASILLTRALSPVDLAIGTWRTLVSARGAYGRLNELLDRFPSRDQAIRLPVPEGRVQAENLVVAPPGSREAILKGLNFVVPAGSVVAVVGQSASGKSTLARTLVGVWAPLGGTLRLDGAEVHKWNKVELGSSVGYLPQDIELFEGTIAENIARFGDLDSDRILEAARKAGVHEIVLRLPQGYETPIGEGGLVLSAGQRQRVALARALYGNPALVVLDEPNANLDEAGDAALLAALRTMKEEKTTVFVVTHRVNVLSVVDAVMVLSAGLIRAFGPRDAVLKGITSPAQSVDARDKGTGSIGVAA
jgi:ATP-binding cassette subfamily C exporter for protease/lipase